MSEADMTIEVADESLTNAVNAPGASGPDAQLAVPVKGQRSPLHDEHGRFALGNPGGPGNPLNAAACKFRAVLAEEATDPHLRAVARKLIDRAEAGEPWAVREMFDRLMGRAAQSVDITAAGAAVLLKIVQGVSEDRL